MTTNRLKNFDSLIGVNCQIPYFLTTSDIKASKKIVQAELGLQTMINEIPLTVDSLAGCPNFL